MTRVLVVGGTPALEAAVLDRGYDLDIVARVGEDRPEFTLDAAGDDTNTIIDRVRVAHTATPFDAVLSLTESRLVLAAQLAEILGLPGNDVEVPRTLRDKPSMRAVLAKDPAFAVAHWKVASQTDLETAIRSAATSLIVKPAAGTASIGVIRIDSPDDVTEAWGKITQAEGGPWIAEELLEGPEFSVEAFSVDGKHTIVAVTEKRIDPNTFVELAHVIPARISADTATAISEYVRAFLDRIALSTGPSHTEVKLTPVGPRVIESHDRIGGDKIRELVRLATGIDLLSHALQAALGKPEQLEPPSDAGAAVQFITAPAGRVASILLPTLKQGEDIVVTASIGDVVPEKLTSAARLGYVLVAAVNADYAARRAEELARSVVISTR